MANNQNAQELAIRTFEIFRDELKPLDLPNTTRSFLTTELRSSSVAGDDSNTSESNRNSISNKGKFTVLVTFIEGENRNVNDARVYIQEYPQYGIPVEQIQGT